MHDKEPIPLKPSRLAPLLYPVNAFLSTESSGGIVLLVAAVAALGWANSPWGDSYQHFWHSEAAISVFGRVHAMSLEHLVNDGLMAVFFLLVGLEIKRELLLGELASLRRASLPIIAAIGGMVVPAGIYLAFNAGKPGMHGWGVPMATDIAFAVGVLAVVGRNVPTSVKVFLLAVAIVDDLGAVLVIAIFYTGRYRRRIPADADWACGLACTSTAAVFAAGRRTLGGYAFQRHSRDRRRRATGIHNSGNPPDRRDGLCRLCTKDAGPVRGGHHRRSRQRD